MQVIHDNYFTVILYSDHIGGLFTPYNNSTYLNNNDIYFITQISKQVTYLTTLNEVSSDKIKETIDQHLYRLMHNKISQGVQFTSYKIQ